MNAIHGSDSVEAANREIALWFNKKEMVNWKDHSHDWVYEPPAAPKKGKADAKPEVKGGVADAGKGLASAALETLLAK